MLNWAAFAFKIPFVFQTDPSLQLDKKKAMEQKTTYFKDMYERLNQTSAFEALFTNLWYSTMPCFDVRGTHPFGVSKIDDFKREPTCKICATI